MNTNISCDAVISAKRIGCKRFLFTGSVDEYEACLEPDAHFIMPSHSRIYGIAKFAAENIGKTIALSLGIEYVSVLLSLTYGEGNKTKILPNTIIRNTEAGLPIKLITGNNLFDMNYIDAVSYTHLVVIGQNVNFTDHAIQHIEKFFEKYNCAIAVEPVSYTHLDVYKRQGLV